MSDAHPARPIRQLQTAGRSAYVLRKPGVAFLTCLVPVQNHMSFLGEIERNP